VLEFVKGLSGLGRSPHNKKGKNMFPKSVQEKDTLLKRGQLAAWWKKTSGGGFLLCHVCLRFWRRIEGRRYFEVSPRAYIYTHKKSEDMAICPECAQDEKARWSRMVVRARNDRSTAIKERQLYKSLRGNY
jgi:hypothetical protein